MFIFSRASQTQQSEYGLTEEQVAGELSRFLALIKRFSVEFRNVDASIKFPGFCLLF